ncbi:MAG: GHKL domain-containing protein [Cyclobacteriaceae bacterium]|nr:GHKL domain-containing protein [Cyclobacteriaceae bacterium]
MAFNPRSPLLVRIGGTALLIFFAAFFLFKSNLTLFLIFGAVVALQVFHLVQFLQAGQPIITPPPSEPPAQPPVFDEVTQTFRSGGNRQRDEQLSAWLNEALQKIKASRRERDSDLQFFKNVIQHISIGLITFRTNGSIQMINTAARRLLKLERAQNIQDIREVSEPLVEACLKLKTGGRELVRLKSGDETLQISVFAIELTLRGEELNRISMHNIQSELEEKEMEAWQNLVRVLTHEIMNSVTPISSLAGIVEEDLSGRIRKENLQISREEMEDMHLSLQTITRRSEGLIRFVKEFRNLTHIPKPRLTDVPVQPLLDELVMLHKKELSDKGIEVTVDIQPEQLILVADKNMIEQVLINLLKNAIQAFDEQPNKAIHLRAFTGDKGRPVISIKDNGPGIEPEALEKIFIPFFSTKKTGSGIGLSLSKQIMRQHDGRITVKSTLGEGTEFLLRF